MSRPGQMFFPVFRVSNMIVMLRIEKMFDKMIRSCYNYTISSPEQILKEEKRREEDEWCCDAEA